MSQAVYIHSFGLVSAMGVGLDAHAQALTLPTASTLTQSDQFSPGRQQTLGVVNAPLPSLANWAPHQQSRNNQLLWAAFAQIQSQYQKLSADVAATRIAVVLGTSTSGIGESEACFAADSSAAPNYLRQQIAAPAAFLADQLGIAGPVYTLSTACTSGAKALASAQRLLNSGQVDLVLAGGVDALCGLTVNGFSALEAISAEPCQPLSANRNGINIGEGAGLFLLSRAPASLALLAAGETSDAHHISAPDPSGVGAEDAIRGALKAAKLPATAVGYLNLHGTATELNDKMESCAVARVFGEQLAVSSTKPLTGHTLGAAGAIEAGICCLALTADALPVHHWDGVRDPQLPALTLVRPGHSWPQHTAKVAMSTSFAFGGNNIALLLANSDAERRAGHAVENDIDKEINHEHD